MGIPIMVTSIPNIPKTMDKDVTRLDMVLGNVLLVDEQWIKHARPLRITMLKKWLMDIQTIRLDLIRRGIEEKSNNSAAWTVMNKQAIQEVNRINGLLKKYYNEEGKKDDLPLQD